MSEPVNKLEALEPILKADNLSRRVKLVFAALVFCSVVLASGLLIDFNNTFRVIISPGITKAILVFVGFSGIVVGLGSLYGVIRIYNSGRVLLNIRDGVLYATNLLRSTSIPVSDLRGYRFVQYAKKSQTYLLLEFESGSFNVPLDITTAQQSQISSIIDRSIGKQ